MLNQSMLVGRVCRDTVVKNLNEGRKVATFTLAVQREFKNQEGTYDVDFIKITAWDHLAGIATTHCTKGQMCCVKARLVVSKYPLSEEKKINILELIAEKIIMISPNKFAENIPEDKDDEEID